MATNQSDHETVEQILNLYSDHDIAQIFWALWNGNQRDPDFITEIGDAIMEREEAETLREALKIVHKTAV